MRRTCLSIAFGLISSGAVLAADPPKATPIPPAATTKATPVPTVTVQPGPAPVAAPAAPAAPCNCRPNLVRRFFRGDGTNAATRPIILDGDFRYEPAIRDIRYAPSSSTLPGSGLGAPDTINIVPSYGQGYFRLFRSK